MSRPKIHHYNPQSVLRNFSIDGAGKQVWVFDKETGRSRTESISTAGGEKHFNQVVIGNKGVVFEGIFDSVDGALPGLLGKIIAAKHVAALDETDRDALALVTAVQFLRVQLIRESARAIPDQLRAALADAGLSELAAAVPAATENDGRRVGLALLADAKKSAGYLRFKELTLYQAPDGLSFWSSDTPVAMANHFPLGDLGLGARGIEVFWPISPKFVLSFRCPSIRKKAAETSPRIAAFLETEPRLICRQKDVNWMNELQVRRSMRFLYAPTDDFSVASRILAEPGGATPSLLVSISPLGTIPRRAGMPPGISLIASGRETEHLCPVANWQDEDGGIRVRVRREAANTAGTLLADGPFASVEIHDAEGPGRGMRDVVIESVSENPLELLIQHGDPGLRDLARQLDERTDSREP